MVSCSGFGLPMHAQLLRLFVTNMIVSMYLPMGSIEMICEGVVLRVVSCIRIQDIDVEYCSSAHVEYRFTTLGSEP